MNDEKSSEYSSRLLILKNLILTNLTTAKLANENTSERNFVYTFMHVQVKVFNNWYKYSFLSPNKEYTILMLYSHTKQLSITRSQIIKLSLFYRN